MAQSLVLSRKENGLVVWEKYLDLLDKVVDSGAGVWIDRDYWTSNVVYVVHTSDVRPYSTIEECPGIIAVSKDGLMLRIADDLSYINIESIHECEG